MNLQKYDFFLKSSARHLLSSYTTALLSVVNVDFKEVKDSKI